MGTARHKNINEELIKSLQNLISNLGGIPSASKFLDIGRSTLKGYLYGDEKEIRNDIWRDKLLPLIKKKKKRY